MKSDWPKITIITPSYQQGKYIEQTILSVINQKYPNLEYIIIDGGSTDESFKIIKKYENKLAYWQSVKDGGQTDGINQGLKRSKGEIISWLNSDDVLCDGTLFKVAEFFIKEQDAAILSGDYKVVDENNKVIWQPRIVNTAFTKKSDLSIYDLLRCWRFTLPQPSTFWNKKTFSNLGLLNEELHFAMDLEYWLRAIKNEIPIYRTNEIFSVFRVHGASKTSKLEEKQKSELKILQKTYLKGFFQTTGYNFSFYFWFYSEGRLYKALNLLENKRGCDAMTELFKSIIFWPLNIVLKARLYFSFFKLIFKNKSV